MRHIFNIKTFYTFLSKNKFYTAIEVFGLSISLMFVVLIALYTTQELSVDRWHENADRIFIVGVEQAPLTAAAIPQKLKAQYPEIEKVCPVVLNNKEGEFNSHRLVTIDEETYHARTIYTDSLFFDFFSFRLLEGDRNSMLRNPNGLVISASFARSIFGTTQVIGKTVTFDYDMPLTIEGVVEDFKNTSLGKCDLLVARKHYYVAEDDLRDTGSTVAFVMTSPGIDFRERTDDITDYFKTFFWMFERGMDNTVRIESLQEFYMSGWSDRYSLESGDEQFIVILISIGILILLFAILNYINLSVAQAGYRYKEMAMRRLLGSGRRDLFMRLMVESTTLVLLSVLLSLLFALMARQFVDNLLGRDLEFSTLLSPVWIFLLVGVVLVVGILSGWVPATIVSRAEPMEIVRGTFRRKTKMAFSKLFISFQSFVTAIMLGVALIITHQVNHLLDAPLGYNTENIIEVAPEGLQSYEQLNAFVEAARTTPGVKRIGYTYGSPTTASSNTTRKYIAPSGEEKVVSFQMYSMDQECFEMLGLRMIKENGVDKSGHYINEEAFRQLELSPDATHFRCVDMEPIKIAGVFSNFYERNILGRYPPILFSFRDLNEGFSTILIETEGDRITAKLAIAQAYKEAVGVDAVVEYMADKVTDSLAPQIRLAKIVSLFTLIAIIISLLGLIAISTYFIQQREREVALRKAFGASSNSILQKLVLTFLRYTFFAFLASVPVVVYVMTRWLESYSYRIAIQPWMFVVVGLFCTLIGVVAVGIQSWRAANSNPIGALKRE